MNTSEKKNMLSEMRRFLKIFFSPDIMMQVAREMQEEYDQSRRDAADQQASETAKSHEQLNHC